MGPPTAAPCLQQSMSLELRNHSLLPRSSRCFAFIHQPPSRHLPRRNSRLSWSRHLREEQLRVGRPTRSWETQRPFATRGGTMPPANVRSGQSNVCKGQEYGPESKDVKSGDGRASPTVASTPMKNTAKSPLIGRTPQHGHGSVSPNLPGKASPPCRCK